MTKQIIFCTLFGSNYLDKGLVMYHSLVKCGCNFKLYVLPMDDKCNAILNNYNYSNVTVLNFKEFVDRYNLKNIFDNRNFGVFCWTCTPFLIDYVLANYQEPWATYIDADLCFYNDPLCLLEEMGNKSVQIVPHRYNSSIHGAFLKKNSGTYCVQFNTFKNTKDAMDLLHWWCDQCYLYCSSNYNSVFGDQGYLEKWELKSNVSVLKHMGGGVAPWNIAQYKAYTQYKADNEELKCFFLDKVVLENKFTLEKFPLIFYHFQGITYLSEHCANINIYEPWKTDRKLVVCLYKDYLKRIDEIKKELHSKYNLHYLINKHPACDINPLIKRKSFMTLLKSLFSIIKPSQFYLRIIYRASMRLYGYLNIVRF